MSLDLLYNLVKLAKFPINSRREVLKVIGTNKIEFNGHRYDSRIIALQIDKYPINSPAQFIESFIYGYEEYNPQEDKLLNDMIERAKT